MKKVFDFFYEILKTGSFRMHDDKIVAITKIMFCLQLVLRELIQLVEIDIRKQLTRHIAKRQSFSFLFFKTRENDIDQPHRVGIRNFLSYKPP